MDELARLVPRTTDPDYSIPRFIKAEVNLLRLPLFALSTKNLKTLDGIECRGSFQKDGQAHEYVFRATRNTSTLYPGPLSRRAHIALLSIATGGRLPIQNPIRWSYRDLCRRMGVGIGGWTAAQVRQAITATALLGIQSHHALYSKANNRRIKTVKAVLHLYDQVVFAGDEVRDGEGKGALTEGAVADSNYLWFSDWYLQNLNALYTAPLNYKLWQWLDDQSTIASRLYEFLLVNMYAGHSPLRINYETLVPFLPIRPERYLSQAKGQLDPALKLLTNSHVIAGAHWSKPKQGLGQLAFHRGRQLAGPDARNQVTFPFMEEEFTGAMAVKELRNVRPPEWGLVADFYRLWSNRDRYRPNPKELAQARELIGQYGPAKTKHLLPLVIERLKKKWPAAKTFAAVTTYIGEVADSYDAEQHHAQRIHDDQDRRQREREADDRRRVEEQDFETTWLPVWEQLPATEQEAIRNVVIGDNPFLKRFSESATVRFKCLRELARRQGALRE